MAEVGMYLERLTNAGLLTNRHYVPGGKFNTSSPGSSIQIPNCTMNAFCGGYEESDAVTRFDLARKGGGFSNAKNWWEESPLPKGSEPRIGSICVFDGNYGHVIVLVRHINGKRFLVHDSSFDENKKRRDWKFWRIYEVDLEVGTAPISGVGKIKGFLYLPINDIRVERNIKKEQIEVKEEMVNVRKTPNGEIYLPGCYCPMGVFNVLSKKVVDGYTWYELQENHWIREGEWLVHYDKGSVDNNIEQIKEYAQKILDLCK